MQSPLSSMLLQNVGNVVIMGRPHFNNSIRSKIQIGRLNCDEAIFYSLKLTYCQKKKLNYYMHYSCGDVYWMGCILL